MKDGAVSSDWSIAGTRVVNDVRGRRSRATDYDRRQQNTDEVIFSFLYRLVG